MAKRNAHEHAYDRHPNPNWATHASCTICGFALPKRAILQSINGISIPCIKLNQLSDALAEELLGIMEFDGDGIAVARRPRIGRDGGL